MIGTIVNTATILTGSIIGSLLKKGIKDGIASVQLPKIKALDSKNGASANNKTSEPKTDSNGFVTISGTEEEIPF